MAKSCKACQDLQTDAPNLIVNGLGSSEIASLKNNTGLSPSNGNNDCTDLNNMNDCLIGNMEEEIDAYDVCDWKDYTKNLVNNIWTVFGGVIAAICGLWTNVMSLWGKIDAMCDLVDSLISPPLGRYGTLLNDYGAQHPTHRGGTIGVKSGKPVVVPMAQSEVDALSWKAQSVGIYLGKQKMSKCSDGKCQNYEWIAPNIVAYRVNPELDLAAGDILWYATKAECTAWGMSENMWNAFEVSSWTWFDYGLTGTPQCLGWFKLSVDNNRLELTYQGQVGATTDNSNRRIIESNSPEKRYIFNC